MQNVNPLLEIVCRLRVSCLPISSHLMQTLSTIQVKGGAVHRCQHASTSTKTNMTFTVFVPKARDTLMCSVIKLHHLSIARDFLVMKIFLHTTFLSFFTTTCLLCSLSSLTRAPFHILSRRPLQPSVRPFSSSSRVSPAPMRTFLKRLVLGRQQAQQTSPSSFAIHLHVVRTSRTRAPTGRWVSLQDSTSTLPKPRGTLTTR